MKTWGFIGVAAALFLSQTNGYSQTITLDEYLNDVKERHPFFAAQSMQPEIEASQRDRFLGEKDWVLTSSPFANFQQPIVANTFSPERITRLDLNAGLERTYWGNGSRLALTWESAYVNQKVPGIVIPTSTGPIAIPVGTADFYENRLLATYSYPLLQNNGGILDQLQYYLADRNIDFSQIESVENQENFLLDAGARYVDWALVLEQMRISEERLSYEEEQLDQITRKRRSNLVDEVDVLRGKNAVDIAQENLTFNRSRAMAKKAELAVLAQNEAINNSTPDIDIYAMESMPSIDDVLRKIPGQRVVRALAVRVEQLKLQTRALDNVTKPQLYVGVSGGVQQGNAEFVKSWELTNPDLTFFVDFRYPLGNHTATADVAKNTLEIRQLEKQIESVSLNLEAELRRIWIEITELEKVLVLNQGQVETALEKTVEEQKVYDQGRSDLTFVIQSRDDVSIAQLRYAINAATYQKLFLSYRAMIDELMPTD
jgi:outer membrane protein TolC